MLTIIYNKDGSIKNLKLPTYVNQGSNNVDKVFVAVDGLDTDEYTVSANFRLPNHTTSEIAAASTDEETIDETTYAGRSFYLTTAQTYYAGRLLLSISLTQNANQIKWTYPVEIVINPTTFDPTSDDSNITNAQYYSLLGALNVKQDKYAIGNVRFYKTYIDLVNDIANIVNYQVCATKDSDGNIVFYQKDDGVLVLIEYPITESDYESILDRLDSLETNKRDKINNTSNKFLLYMSTPSNTDSSIQLDDNPSSVTVAWRTGTGELKGETRVASGDKVLVNKLYLATYFYDKTEIDSKISSVYKFKGSVATYDDLPSTDLTIGDVYNVEDTGDNYAWTGTAWDKLAGEIDLSNYYTKTETDTLLGGKQDVIDAEHKLSADLVDDTNTTNKFVTAADKTNWNGKADKTYVDETFATKTEFNALKLLVEEAIVDTSDYQINYWDIDNVPMTINSYPTLVSAGLDIKALRGRSVAFNQCLNTRSATSTNNGLTITWNTDGTISYVGTATATMDIGFIASALVDISVPSIQGHKYLFKLALSGSIGTGYFSCASLNYNIKQDNIYTAGSGSFYGQFHSVAGETYNFTIRPQIFDLTLMGLDSITSVLEFNKLFPQAYYEYNIGTMLSSKASALDVVGYNKFDGELEIGHINNDGSLGNDQRFERSKNYIKVIPGQTYSLEQSGTINDSTRTQRDVVEYDENYNFIKKSNRQNSQGQFLSPLVIQLQPNTRYVKIAFYLLSNRQQKVENISFHLTWDGSHTGYKPYESKTYALPNIELRSVGTAYDELKPDGTLITRIGVVDLGTLNWNKAYNTDGFWYFDLSNSAPQRTINNFIISSYRYSKKMMSDEVNDLTCGYSSGTIRFMLKDLSYTTLTQIQQALSGVYLYYELAEPTETQTEYTFIDSIESLQDGATLSQTSSVGLGYVIDTEMAIYKPKGE